jgi:hypothetical protein
MTRATGSDDDESPTGVFARTSDLQEPEPPLMLAEPGVAPCEFAVDVRLRASGPVHRGNTSVVYMAEQAGFARRLALKVFDRRLLQDRSRVARILDEAAKIADCGHPNIVDIVSAGGTCRRSTGRSQP